MAQRNIKIWFTNKSPVNQLWSSSISQPRELAPNTQVRYNTTVIGDNTIQIVLDVNDNHTGVSLRYSWDDDKFSLNPESNDFKIILQFTGSVVVRSTYTGADAVPKGLEVNSIDTEPLPEDMSKASS
ncbi:uncharacterized protein Z520_03443 [Fonsecaea multimorphosa CBS 102226]|uniref:Uncharacterized protein n=1 Tax=Fonsecaea multimorphosa CBS 102226 TaxID=1442371 RepID=A0A0D2K4P2_9EURO|nr:uncharacterized protein Z520_03443 [Fonsecaea multimorphosa CBS 102226]KIY00778.1 hypothetical protein Z520_03443 [Fonsecaea multimorphosa CBS 102226]OAL27877.1 hypothetical protein AYO22_03222 [Fonsecaea multimorphosa]